MVNFSIAFNKTLDECERMNERMLSLNLANHTIVKKNNVKVEKKEEERKMQPPLCILLLRMIKFASIARKKSHHFFLLLFYIEIHRAVKMCALDWCDGGVHMILDAWYCHYKQYVVLSVCLYLQHKYVHWRMMHVTF